MSRSREPSFVLRYDLGAMPEEKLVWRDAETNTRDACAPSFEIACARSNSLARIESNEERDSVLRHNDLVDRRKECTKCE